MMNLTNNDFTVSSIANLVPAIAASSGVFSFDETNAAAQTVTTLIISARAHIGSFWFDMTNVTQNTTIAFLYQVDGVNYRTFREIAWTVADDDGVFSDGVTISDDLRITFTCGGGGGGNVNVPYAIL